MAGDRMQKGAANRRDLGSVWRYLLAGFVIIVGLVGGVGVWASQTEISGAVIAQGTVVVESSIKKVQHPSGGVVGEIHVKNGDFVQAGDLLLRLDETVTRASLQMVTKQLDELAVREARLVAERDDANAVPVPPALSDRQSETAIGEILGGERSLFESRRNSRQGQKSQLRERIAQLDQEFAGISGQLDAKAREIQLIGKQLRDLETLEEKKLVTAATMVALRRESARLEGEYAQLKAAAAQTRGRVSEIELQILRIDQDMRTEVVKELRECQSKIAEFTERRVAAEDQLKRVDLRAPQSGTVHQLAVHTVGGVINGGEAVMFIVPDSDKLVVEAKIAPHDIDQVLGGRQVMLRFAAFNQRTTPELVGEIVSISADLAQDPRTGENYFTGRISVSDEEMTKLDGGKLVPGMPAEVHIKTHDRTALSYLVKPFQDQVARAFRER
jgi:HlyD family secretion protein